MVINSVLLLHTVVQSVLGNVQVPFFMRYSMKMCFFFLQSETLVSVVMCKRQ